MTITVEGRCANAAFSHDWGHKVEKVEGRVPVGQSGGGRGGREFTDCKLQGLSFLHLCTIMPDLCNEGLPICVSTGCDEDTQ